MRIGKLILLAVCLLYLFSVAFFSNSYAACERKTFLVRGVERSAIICVPSSVKTPMPTIFSFHGRSDSAESMVSWAALHKQWSGALVIYPDGLVGNPAPYDPNGDMSGWQIDIGDLGDRDIAFTDAILTYLSKNYNVDWRRVFAVGHSNGARFSALLWSARTKCFAAFAFSAGQADKLIEKAEPRSIFIGMGMKDDLILFDGQKKSINYATSRFGVPYIDVGRVGINSVQNKDGIELMTFIHGGGHVWPIEQTKLIIDFLERQTVRLIKSGDIETQRTECLPLLAKSVN